MFGAGGLERQCAASHKPLCNSQSIVYVGKWDDIAFTKLSESSNKSSIVPPVVRNAADISFAEEPSGCCANCKARVSIGRQA